MRVMGI